MRIHFQTFTMKATVPVLISLLSALKIQGVPTASPTEPDPANFVNVTLNGQKFIDKVSGIQMHCHFPFNVFQGMVAFGRIPADFKDSTGDTFGGVGSAIAIKRGTWTQNSNGSFSGSLIVQPDRGFNVYVSVLNSH